MSADKTNVMRSLDQKKIKYKVHEYKESGAVSGVEVAAALGQDPKRAFKTLVTESLVLVINVAISANISINGALTAILIIII